ncbi:hypothetical protein FNV43_RR07501 [Rhamnella rubrinervis]|uniref:LOB domain-containing protein n=1 Tax=Rhamnella rubrinervis TaxID=2594499 RepID=A0A8K0HFE7_9ROSA|nr:hypothetical protein FNV43_RR07501 [Rhamnella rubrinervis]
MVLKRQNEEGGSGIRNTRQACAACKLQRRKCKSDCVTAPYFPAETAEDFKDTHKIFGVSNITKWLQSLDSEANKKAASDSFKWEASVWKTNPGRGPLGVYQDLQKEYKELEEKYKELLIKGQGVHDQLNHNPPINKSSSQQLQDHHRQFVQNNNDNLNVRHPNRALMNIGRHGQGHECPPPNMMNNNNSIDHRYNDQYLMMPWTRMESLPVPYNYGPLVHDNYGGQVRGRGSIIRPNSMSQTPQPLFVNGLMINNSYSNPFHRAGSSHSLGPSTSNNFGNYSTTALLNTVDQNEHDVGVPSNPAAAINPTAQPFHARPSPTQVRRSTQATRGVHSLQQRHQQHLLQRYSSHQNSNNQGN